MAHIRTWSPDAAPPTARSRVSIVIAAFNAAAFLPKAIQSVQAQTVSTWEVIVIDDGSSDGTGDVARGFAATDERVRVFQQANGGASSARNLGLSHARCEWLLFLDSDDWLVPEFLQKMLCVLDSRADTEIVCCPYRRVTSDGRILPTEWWPEVESRPFEAFARECVLCIHCVIVRTELVREVGGFDVGLKTCEDWDLWLRIARTGKTFVPLMDTSGFYQIRSDSLSNTPHFLYYDALTVMGRAWTADPRVRNPDPRYAEGFRPPDGDVSDHVAFWLAAVEAGANLNGCRFLDQLADTFQSKDDIDSLAECVYQGFKVGAQLRPEAIAHEWPRLEESARIIFIRIADCRSNPDRLHGLMATLESKVLKGSDLSQPLTLTTMTGLRIDVTDFTPTEIPLDTDSLHLELRSGPDLLGHVVVPGSRAESKLELPSFTVRQSGLKKIVSGGGLLRSPTFWLQTTRELAGESRAILAGWFDKRTSREQRIRSLARAVVGRAVVRTISSHLAPPDAQGSRAAHDG